MGIGKESIREELAKHLPENEYHHLIKSYRYSEDVIAQIRSAIANGRDAAALNERGYGYAVIGSLGRMEAGSEESDADLVLLCTSAAEAADPVTHKLDQRVRAEVSSSVGIKVSKGENMTSPSSVDSIADVNKIGGDSDNVNLLTKRILLLIEGRPVYNDDQVDRVRRGVLQAYSLASDTKGKHLHSLANDIGRYYRTVCVDYKSRVDSEKKPWGIRNIKLRHRSKFLFFSSMLAMVAAAMTSEREEEEADVYRAFCDTPTERLVDALLRCNLLAENVGVIHTFDAFIGALGNAAVREELEVVRYQDRKASDTFMRMHDNSKALNAAMISTIVKLPERWRDHLLSVFLL